MCAPLGDDAVLHDQDLVRMRDGRQAVARQPNLVSTPGDGRGTRRKNTYAMISRVRPSPILDNRP